ncbi:MAG: hypothetical protein V4717_20325 [Bacteroidota bacterium]
METTNAKLRNNLRQPRSMDYWYDIVMGGFLTSSIMISIGILLLMKLNLVNFSYPYAALCIAIVAYFQWRDDNLKEIETGLSKSGNFDLAAATLDTLNWHFKKGSTNIYLSLNKYILNFLNPTIIPESGKILINFKYHSTSKTGRFPFFFGISTYLEWCFTKTLKRLL